DSQVTVGGEQPATATLADGIRLQQLRDDSYTVGDQTGERAPGWIAAGDGETSAVMVCRDFWQLYPKAIGAEDGVLYLDICPEFAPTEYNDCSELDLIKLYYYLQDGVYKVRQGVTKTHEIWLGLVARAVDPIGMDAEAAAIDEPSVLAAPPEYYAASGVFGDFIPRTAESTPRYDEVCDRCYSAYTAYRENGRNYGMLNYGDQWGERRVNWSNGEYDHHHTAAQMFVRGAEARWLPLMRATARHEIDVDLCHYHTNAGYRGASWTHSMGHTGSYFTQQYQGEYGSPSAGMSPTHTWCEGTCEYYMLTGDPTAIEAARSIGDHYGGAYLNNYDFTNGRVPGWHLILTMAVYRTTYDPFYLNAARIIVNRALERRTPGGGWERQLVPGHCYCEPRCRGACSFMQGILGVGLREYWRETRDERVPPAVVDSARYVVQQMWDNDREMFRYTSCPESSYTATQADTLAGLMLFAWEMSGDQRLLDIAERAINLDFEGLSSIAHVRWTPYIVWALERAHEQGIGVGGPADVLLTKPDERGFEVRLFDRQGAGAPASAATLTGPDGKTWEIGDDGRILVPQGPAGSCRLHIEPGDPVLLSSSLNRMVVSLREPVALDLPDGRRSVYVMPARRGEAITVKFARLTGKAVAELISPSGEVLCRTRGDKGGELTARATEDGLYEVALRGPGRVALQAEGVKPWLALMPGQWFNASAPSVTIEGGNMLAPGQGR
ncbi:MAG TPA: hypothetical protein VM283_05220, partial [Armatimonadota bacterium]|nr:hypothetical protein [Armatimonadota bacterium]